MTVYIVRKIVENNITVVENVEKFNDYIRNYVNVHAWLLIIYIFKILSKRLRGTSHWMKYCQKSVEIEERKNSIGNYVNVHAWLGIVYMPLSESIHQEIVKNKHGRHLNIFSQKKSHENDNERFAR